MGSKSTYKINNMIVLKLKVEVFKVVSLFNGISTFLGYLKKKPYL